MQKILEPMMSKKTTLLKPERQKSQDIHELKGVQGRDMGFSLI